MPLRMLNFICPKCGKEWEDLVDVGKDESPGCPDPECNGIGTLDEDLRKRLHRDGAKYRHVSWSLHNASS